MFKPLKDRVVILRDESTTEIGGLLIPEEARTKELFGTVVAMGPEVISDLSIGSRVFFGKGDGVTIDSKFFETPGDYIIVRDEQIRGVVNVS